MSNELETIRKIMSQHLESDAEFEDDTPLVSGGRIDSMSLVDVIMDLQDAFDVTIVVSEVQPSDFDSVNTIAATVARFR